MRMRSLRRIASEYLGEVEELLGAVEHVLHRLAGVILGLAMVAAAIGLLTHGTTTAQVIEALLRSVLK